MEELQDFMWQNLDMEIEDVHLFIFSVNPRKTF